MEGQPVAQAPRNVLLKQINAASEQGLFIKTGIEAEFLLNADGSGISDNLDTSIKPCYDQQAIMRRYDVIAEICDCMLEMGWQPIKTIMRMQMVNLR